MNVVGRQMQRSSRDNSSNNSFIEVPSKWLQSANQPQVYFLFQDFQLYLFKYGEKDEYCCKFLVVIICFKIVCFDGFGEINCAVNIVVCLNYCMQDYGFYGGEGGSKWNRNLQRSLNSGNDFPLDPPSPLNSSRALRKTGDDGIVQNEYSPGLLDLHSFDTDLISEV